MNLGEKPIKILEIVLTTFRNRQRNYAHLPEHKIEKMRRKILANVLAADAANMTTNQLVAVVQAAFDEQERQIRVIPKYDPFETANLAEW